MRSLKDDLAAVNTRAAKALGVKLLKLCSPLYESPGDFLDLFRLKRKAHYLFAIPGDTPAWLG